jgi:hypothetical protein
MANPGKERWRDVQWIFDIYEVLLMPVFNLGNLEMDLLAMLILIMMVIWISGGLSYDIFSTLVVCVVSWKASLQATIALSTIEDEYMAISEACKEAIGLRSLYSKLCAVTSCITINYDC